MIKYHKDGSGTTDSALISLSVWHPTKIIALLNSSYNILTIFVSP